MRHRNRVARALRATLAGLTAAAMLALGIVGGLTYLWCAPMAEARLHCCCPDQAGDAEHSMVRLACCEERVVAELPAGADDIDSTPAVAPAALDLTWLATLDTSLVVTTARASTLAGFDRSHASPAVRVHSRCSVYLL